MRSGRAPWTSPRASRTTRCISRSRWWSGSSYVRRGWLTGNSPAHLAQTDAAGCALEDDGVAVAQEARVTLEQRALAAGRGAGDRAGGVDVAGPRARAIDGRVRELLGEGPVQVARVRAADRLAVQLDLELDVERVVARGLQVGDGLGDLGARGDEVRLERLQRRDPGRQAGGERLAEEGAERAILEALDVARAPVVEQREPEHVISRVPRGDARPGRTGDERQLQLDVELLGRAEHRPQAVRAGDRRSGDDHRPGPAVIADRQVEPIRRERVVGAPLAADVRRVLDRRVEVDVVADLDRQLQLGA